MNRITQKILVVALSLMTFCSFSQNSVFPQPEVYKQSTGSLQLTNKTPIFIKESGFSDLISVVNDHYKNINSSELIQASSVENANIVCSQNGNLAEESYQIIISSKEVQITFADYNGLLYALHTFNQLITSDLKVNCAVVNDSPRFSYRGTHLDCSRHFFTISEIKKFVDELAALKINRFHWHLTDDQGWRIEIKKYPKLTDIGGFRDSTLIGHIRNTPMQFEKKHYGGFYTQEEIKEFVLYCQKRGITVIPEIELPGHARAALAAYPEYGCSGEFNPVASTWGVFNEVFCSKDETINFLKDILDEVMALFPSKTIHVGGDEVPKTSWKSCSKCQAQKSKHDLKDEFELQRFIIEEMEKHLRKNGRNLMGWDEILEGGLAENAQVMSWRGIDGGFEAANSGHFVVMTPGSHCYFDHYQSAHPDEQLSWGGFTPLEKVFAFEPIPEKLAKDKHHFILGAQANLWTEYLPEIQNVEINAFPRMIALTEVLWSKNKRSYSDFLNDLITFELPRLDKNGMPYSKALFDPNCDIVPTTNGINIVSSTSISGQKLISTPSFTLYPTKKAVVNTVKVESEYMGQKIRNTEFQLTTHLAIGKKITFETPPKAPYTYQQEFGFTNGIVGSKPWKGKQWLGFTNDTIEFTLDLEKKTKFKTIKFQCLNENNSWIYLPKSLEIWTSNDGINFSKSMEMKTIGEWNRISQNTKARYLKFVFIQDKTIPLGKPGEGFSPWTFIDEIIITK
jgi:hexosaminidase